MELLTQRLLLRPWREADADALYEIGRNPEVRSAGWEVYTSLEQAVSDIAVWKTLEDTWAVVRRDTEYVVGWIVLEDCGRDERYREMEFVIAASEKRQGYATEAAKAVLGYAFDVLDMSAVAICHYPDNHASRRVIEKCGFTYEGTLRRYSRHLTDSVRYSMLKEEWEERKLSCSDRSDLL